MNNPIVSIVIPVFNAKRYIGSCLDSIISALRGLDSEVLIIDDGSNDGSGEICDDYKNRFDAISVIHTPNSGVSKARNIGLKSAKGKYIVFADADDVFQNDGVSELVCFAENESLDFAFADIKKVDYDGKTMSHFFGEEGFITEDVDDLLFEYLMHPRELNLISFVWNKVFLRKIIEKEGIYFDEGLVVNEDALFVFRYICVCGRIGYLRKPTYEYHTDRDNIGTHKMKQSPLAFIASLEPIYVKLCHDRMIDKESISGAYANAVATLGMRNLFHIIRCGRNAEVYDSVKEVINNTQFIEAMRAGNEPKNENLAIIPWLIRRRSCWGVIMAFRFQIIVRGFLNR